MKYTGEYSIACDNGGDLVVAHYKDGKRHGVFKFYQRNGQLKCHLKYKDGLYHGKCKWFYPNGKHRLVGKYVNGVQHGIKAEFYKNGQIKSWEYRENGKKDEKMEILEYSPQGNLVHCLHPGGKGYIFKNGTIVKEYTQLFNVF